MAYESMLFALGDPTRHALFVRLAGRPRTVNEVAGLMPVSRPAVSQHLRVLREAGLVSEERQGTSRIYRADLEALKTLRAYLDGLCREAGET